jgi:hypothetical protein
VHISRGVETKYLVRTLVQNLRVGANWRSVVGPVARATLLHRWDYLDDSDVHDYLVCWTSVLSVPRQQVAQQLRAVLPLASIWGPEVAVLPE